ncbi:hypothetical protein F511_10403 [Dorcoceras hygrometricum]|uniref:Splicing factor 3B subunit 1-like n=1 Tax=Dorcoceras hygrometricum TaxID=472368 RepID=A0A2Z7CNH2_9LAMI|nr:hypothetical protein F511_10403 [Dorcoceras hygrometricum]
MASSLISSSLHVSFDSVLAMDDTGIVAMFGALVASSLKGFLGCPAIFYEDALTEFFQNGSVRDGMVVSTIQGTSVEISEEIFAGAFELSMDGLTDLSEIPEDLVFDARSIFSDSGKQVSTSCKKREIKIEFRLLSDILAKSIFVKAGSFDDVTHERFLLMDAITGGVRINWGRIMTKKTVHRYVVINEKVSVEEVADKPRVRRTPVKRAVSRKRPATAEAVPLQIVEPTPAVAAEQSPVPKRKSKKRRLLLYKDSDDEIVKERGAVEETVENIFEEQREAASAARIVEETIVGGLTEKASEPMVEKEPVVKSTTEEVRTTYSDDVDFIIEQVIAETAQNETNDEEQNVDGIDFEGTIVNGTEVGEQIVPRDEETDQWFNLSYEKLIAQEADRPVVTASDTDEEMETVDFGTELDSSREALPSYTTFEGWRSLERDREAAISGSVFVRAGNPGFTAGRGFNPAGGAPGYG